MGASPMRVALFPRPSRFGHPRRLNSMGTRFSRRRTTVLVLTGDAGLVRLTRSILEPGCAVIGRAAPGGNADMRAEQADIVIVDAQSMDLDVILAATRSWPDAQLIVLSHEYREADCVVILDADADYLPHPFRPKDLAARVRVAELRRFNAAGRRRAYRKGLLVFRPLRKHPHDQRPAGRAGASRGRNSVASRGPAGRGRGLQSTPRRTRARRLGEDPSRAALMRVSIAPKDRARFTSSRNPACRSWSWVPPCRAD